MVRKGLGISVLTLLTLVAVGCKTTQPAVGGAQNAQISFQSSAAQVALYEIWNIERVTVTRYPDDPGREPLQTALDLGVWCDQAIDPDDRTSQSVRYPFRFSVEIDRIPAGTADIERLTDASFAAAFSSITAYDDTAPVTPSSHPVDWSRDVSDPATPNVTVMLSFSRGRRVSTASLDFLGSLKLQAGAASSYGSICPVGGAQDFGEAGVAGSASFFGMEVLAGDTIVVKACKDRAPSSSVLFGDTQPSFRSVAFLDGRDISNAVLGTIESPQQSQEEISYSFTAH